MNNNVQQNQMNNANPNMMNNNVQQGQMNNVNPNMMNNNVQQNQMNNINPNIVNNNIQQSRMIKQKLNKVHRINMRKKRKLHMTKKKVVVASGFACVLLVVFACLCVFAYTKFNGYSRTIMIYMTGSDLESRAGLATVDLSSIDYNKMDSKNVKVVLIAGGSKVWHNNFIDVNSTSIYELGEDGFEVVKQQSLRNMGESETLSDFVNYVTDNYKTEKYNLIFWNHGGALEGSNYDDFYSSDSLSLDEVDEALSKTKFTRKKLENVIYRTCLNGTIEVADLFSKYSERLVASEEVTLGASISSTLNFINEINVKDDGYEVGKKFIDAYKKQMLDIENYNKSKGFGSSSNNYSTYSIVDLKYVDELIHNLNEFFKDVDVNNNFEKIAKVRANVFEYGQGGRYDTVDLYTFVEGLKELSPEKAQLVFDSFSEAVIYNWATNSSSRGLSIYFPYSAHKAFKSEFLKVYSKIDALDDYNDIISKFFTIQTTNGKNNQLSFNENNISVTNKGDSSSADFVLELTDEQKKNYAKASYYVFRKEENGEYWPVYIGNKVNYDGDKIYANISGRSLEILDPDNNNYESIPLIEKSEDDTYIKYDVSVYLEKKKGAINLGDFESATLSLMYNKITDEILLGDMVYYSKDSISNIVVDLSQYTHMVIGSFTYDLSDESGNISISNLKQGSYYYGIEVPVNSVSLRLVDYSANPGEYYAAFLIKDVYENSYATELIKMN